MPLIRAVLPFCAAAVGVAEAGDSLVLPAEVGQQLEQTGSLRGDAALNSTLELTASAGCMQCCQTGMCSMAYAGQMGTCCSSQTFGSYSCCPLQNGGMPYQCQATGYQQFSCAPGSSGGYNGGGYNGGGYSPGSGGYNGGGYSPGSGGGNWINLQHGNFDQCYREEQYTCPSSYTDLCCDSNWRCRRNSQGLHCSAYAQEDNYQTLWDYCCPGYYFEDFDLSEEQQNNKKIRSSSSEPATRADALAAFAVAMFMSAVVFAIYTNRSKKSAATEHLLA